jgi:2-polyprenyl-6-methoxyphenol hydroxylase-like FAD-dependent oxidoreductase
VAKTIIIGAGINGLLLGALLAHDGDEKEIKRNTQHEFNVEEKIQLVL